MRPAYLCTIGYQDFWPRYSVPLFMRFCFSECEV
jgi:hypothetical protein